MNTERVPSSMPTALSIAGSDSSGGAGIQADIKTMTALGVYASTAITALTAQNTTGVFGVQAAAPDFLAAQLDAVFSDIPPQAVKTGMLYSRELVRVTAQKLLEYRAPHIVVDPVMVSTSGSPLLTPDAVDTLTGELFPLAEVITPNLPEAEALWGRPIRNDEDRVEAALDLNRRWGCAVLCKGGHQVGVANDLLCKDGAFTWFRGERVDTRNTHGTGCTLSSAMAAFLARGEELEEAISHAKAYLTAAMKTGLDLGAGSGPLNHCFAIHPPRFEKGEIIS